MSTKYKFHNPGGIYFISFAVVDWIDVFTRKAYKDIIIESLKYCCAHKGLRLFAWCIMTNHIHLIFGDKEQFGHSELLRDFKKFTSGKILEAIIDNRQESRKSWMLERFRNAGQKRSNISTYQLWRHDNHPIEVYSPHITAQKLNYIHQNPVRAGFVEKAHHYLYSSASAYHCGTGLIEVEILDLEVSRTGGIIR